MKSILFKISRFPLLSETFIVNQIVTAIKLDYDVRILTEERMDISNCGNPAQYNKYNLDKRIILENYKIPSSRLGRIIKAVRLVLRNLNVVRYLLGFYRLSGKKGLAPLFQFFFYNSLREFDIIHIQFGTNKFPVDHLKKIGFLEAKVIISFHGHDLYFPINGFISQHGYYDKAFQVAEFLVCNTPFLESKLLEVGAPKAKIRNIPVAVDTNYFRSGTKNDEITSIKLVTVGRLDELKGQEYGIAAVQCLLQMGFDVKYFLIGSGPKEQELKERIRNLGLEVYICLPGKASQEEIRKLLQEADIFLMTSIKNSAGMEESQGLVTAEAQACGLPVVAFDSGGVKYTIKDGITGFLCKEKDVEEFVEKIQILIENPSLRDEMGTNAVEFIEDQFSENSVFNKWNDIYR